MTRLLQPPLEALLSFSNINTADMLALYMPLLTGKYHDSKQLISYIMYTIILTSPQLLNTAYCYCNLETMYNGKLTHANILTKYRSVMFFH